MTIVVLVRRSQRRARDKVMEGGLQVAHPGTREKLEEVVENKDKDGDEKDEN